MMTNPSGANKPPPAFLTKKEEPTEQVPTGKPLEMTQNAQLDKPLMKRKKRKGKANPAAALDIEPIEMPKPVALSQIDPPKPVKQEAPKPKLPELPKVEEKKVEAPKPAPAAKKGFLDDSDDDDDEDDFFTKKTPAKNSESGMTINLNVLPYNV
jgi:hypothetical protein